MKKKIASLSFYFLLIFSISPLLVHAGETFQGKGTAIIIGDDLNKAMTLARETAYKRAISAVLESAIKKGTEDETSFRTKKAEMLKKDHPFVTKQGLISQKVTGKYLTVVIAVEVDRKKLVRFVGHEGATSASTKKQKKRDLPSIMVIVTEEIGGRQNSFPYGRAIITDTLLEAKYDLVEQGIVQQSIKHDRAVQGILRGDNKAAQSVAIQYGAGILIIGKSISQAATIKAGGMQPYGANTVLQAVEADTGRILAVASGDGTYPHVVPVTAAKMAIEIATQKAVKKLIYKLDKGMETTEESILVSVGGINFNQLTILKKILQKDFPSILSIKKKSFQGDVAKLKVKTDITPELFAEKVSQKDFGSFRLKLLSYSPKKLDFLLKLKKK